MTGRYGHNNGVGNIIEDNAELSASECTQALALSQTGYNNSLIGKWHLGVMDTNYPAVLGWDHFPGILPGFYREARVITSGVITSMAVAHFHGQ